MNQKQISPKDQSLTSSKKISKVRQSPTKVSAINKKDKISSSFPQPEFEAKFMLIEDKLSLNREYIQKNINRIPLNEFANSEEAEQELRKLQAQINSIMSNYSKNQSKFSNNFSNGNSNSDLTFENPIVSEHFTKINEKHKIILDREEKIKEIREQTEDAVLKEENEYRTISKQYQEMKKIYSKAKRRMDRYDKKAAKSQKSLDELNCTLDANKKKIMSLNEDLKRLETIVKQTNQEIKSTTSDLHKIDEEENQLLDSEKSNQDKMKKLTSLKKEYSIKSKKAQAKRESVEKIISQMNGVENELEGIIDTATASTIQLRKSLISHYSDNDEEDEDEKSSNYQDDNDFSDSENFISDVTDNEFKIINNNFDQNKSSDTSNSSSIRSTNVNDDISLNSSDHSISTSPPNSTSRSKGRISNSSSLNMNDNNSIKLNDSENSMSIEIERNTSKSRTKNTNPIEMDDSENSMSFEIESDHSKSRIKQTNSNKLNSGENSMSIEIESDHSKNKSSNDNNSLKLNGDENDILSDNSIINNSNSNLQSSDSGSIRKLNRNSYLRSSGSGSIHKISSKNSLRSSDSGLIQKVSSNSNLRSSVSGSVRKSSNVLSKKNPSNDVSGILSSSNSDKTANSIEKVSDRNSSLLNNSDLLNSDSLHLTSPKNNLSDANMSTSSENANLLQQINNSDLNIDVKNGIDDEEIEGGMINIDEIEEETVPDDLSLSAINASLKLSENDEEETDENAAMSKNTQRKFGIKRQAIVIPQLEEEEEIEDKTEVDEFISSLSAQNKLNISPNNGQIDVDDDLNLNELDVDDKLSGNGEIDVVEKALKALAVKVADSQPIMMKFNDFLQGNEK